MKSNMKQRAFLCSVMYCGAVFALQDATESVATVEVGEQALTSEADITFFEIAGLKAAKKTLKNGLEVVALQQSSAPRVRVQLIYKGVGSIIEEPEEKGLAHLIEHMIFKGTPTLGEQNYFDVCKRYGATIKNAWTSHDATSYYVEINKNNWKPILHLFADCLQNAMFDSQHLASEVKVVIKELRMGEDDPKNKAVEEFIRTMVSVEHPQHCCIIGYKADLANVTSDSLKNFFKKYYQANNATLFLVGDLDLVDALAAAQAELGVLPCGTNALPPVGEKDYQLNLGFHKVVYAERATDYVLLGWPLPKGFSTVNYQADMLASVLTGSKNGILTKRLVHEERCAQNIDARSYAEYICGGYFFVVCYPLPGQTEKCVTLITQELAKLCASRVDTAVFEGIIAKKHLEDALKLESLANSTGLSGMGSEELKRYVVSNDLENCFNYAEKLAQVTSQDLQEFTSKYLSSQSMSRVDLVPLTESERANYLHKLEEGHAIEAKILANHVRTSPVVHQDLPADYPPAQHVHVTLPKVDIREQLSSGPLIMLKKDASSDICAFELRHKDYDFFSGSLDSVVLGVVSDMLLQGSAKYSRFEIEDYFNKNGVAVSLSGTSWRLTSLCQSFMPALKFFFEVVLTANFNAADLEKIKAQTVNGLMMSKDDSRSLAWRVRLQRLYPHTNLDWSFDDAIARVQALTVDDVRSYFLRYFDPESLICSIVGNIDAQAIRALLTQAVATIPRSGFVVEPFQRVNALDGNIDIAAAKDQVLIMYARQSPLAKSHPDFPAIMLASEILHGFSGGRIWELRDQTGLFYMLWGDFEMGAGFLPGVDMMCAQTGPELLPQAHACFSQFMTEKMRKPVTQKELDNAKVIVRSSLASRFSGVANKAAYFLGLESDRLDEDYYNQLLATIDALTPEDVTAAIARYLDAGEYIRIQVGNIPVQT